MRDREPDVKLDLAFSLRELVPLCSELGLWVNGLPFGELLETVARQLLGVEDLVHVLLWFEHHECIANNMRCMGHVEFKGVA